jgi:tetratricopeptide (TPR) repeat protein
MRFIENLDKFFATNDLKGAGDYLLYWENEARALQDDCGLLSVLNEEIGYYRRTNDSDKGLKAVYDALELLKIKDLTDNVTGATIYINAATTLKCFGKAEEGLPCYDVAEKIYLERGREKSFDYAALLNNKAAALCDLGKYDDAEICYNKAIDILKIDGKHDGEIAVSLVNLAHLIYDRDDTAYNKVEETLDLAWDYINSKNQPHDANYAFIISKCAPSFRYFKREIEADALEETAKEIYESNK